MDYRTIISLLSRSLSSATVNRERERRASQLLHRFPGAAAGSPLLLRPLRRRKGGGTPDLCVSGVNRVWACVAGGDASVGAAELHTAVWSSRFELLLVAALCRDDESVEVPPCGWCGDKAVRARWGSCPCALCRRVVVSSNAGVGWSRLVCRRWLSLKLLEWGCGSWWSPSMSAPAAAGVGVGEPTVARGISPPMFLHRPRFRQSRRMVTAVLQGSFAADGLRLALDQWYACRLHLWRRLGGAAVRRPQAVWWFSSLLQCVCVCCNLLQV